MFIFCLIICFNKSLISKSYDDKSNWIRLLVIFMHKNWASETIHLPPGLLKLMEGTLYNSCATILSFSKRQNVFLKMNHHIFLQYLILQTLMPWPAISISDITWALLPTQWAQRPMEIQTHSQYDIIRLNDRSPLLTLCRHAASPSYCPVFISSTFPDPAYHL